MKPRTVIITLILGLTAVFAALNWETFSRPTQLNVLAGKIEAPLGVVMLILLGALTVLYFLLVARLETKMLLEERRAAKQLEKARKLAESSEASRLGELQTTLEAEFDKLEDKLDGVMGWLEQRQPDSRAQDEPDRRIETARKAI